MLLFRQEMDIKQFFARTHRVAWRAEGNHSEEVPCFLFHAKSHIKTPTLKPEYLHNSLKLLQRFEEARMYLWHNLSTKQWLGKEKKAKTIF